MPGCVLSSTKENYPQSDLLTCQHYFILLLYRVQLQNPSSLWSMDEIWSSLMRISPTLRLNILHNQCDLMLLTQAWRDLSRRGFTVSNQAMIWELIAGHLSLSHSLPSSLFASLSSISLPFSFLHPPYSPRPYILIEGSNHAFEREWNEDTWELIKKWMHEAIVEFGCCFIYGHHTVQNQLNTQFTNKGIYLPILSTHTHCSEYSLCQKGWIDLDFE